MNQTILIAMLRSIQSAATALVLVIDVFLDQLQPKPSGPCAHPENKRQSMAVMGDADRYKCTACSAIVGKEGEIANA